MTFASEWRAGLRSAAWHSRRGVGPRRGQRRRCVGGRRPGWPGASAAGGLRGDVRPRGACRCPLLRARRRRTTGPAPPGCARIWSRRPLLEAGQAALDAGAADAGIETLRRAAEDAARAGDPALEARVLQALGGALVHAVRGRDGEGRSSCTARCTPRAVPSVPACWPASCANWRSSTCRPAGTSRPRALAEAARVAAGVQDTALSASVRAIEGMNAADRGRHGRGRSHPISPPINPAIAYRLALDPGLAATVHSRDRPTSSRVKRPPPPGPNRDISGKAGQTGDTTTPTTDSPNNKDQLRTAIRLHGASGLRGR